MDADTLEEADVSDWILCAGVCSLRDMASWVKQALSTVQRFLRSASSPKPPFPDAGGCGLLEVCYRPEADTLNR